MVNVAKEYTEQLTAERIIELLEAHKSYAGLYFYLGSYIAFSDNPEVHYKYIEAAARTGQVIPMASSPWRIRPRSSDDRGRSGLRKVGLGNLPSSQRAAFIR